MKDINNIKTKLTNNMFNVSNYGAVVIKYVIDMRQVSGFFHSTPVSPTNKTDCHNIIEILLKVVLNTITITISNYSLVLIM
jgi:spore coat protein CotF